MWAPLLTPTENRLREPIFTKAPIDSVPHFPETKTDADGIFRFPNSRAGEMILTIYAKGFAPDLLELDVAPNMRAARIKLQKGAKLALKVVDSDGNPLAGTLVAPDTWRKHRSLCDLPIPRKTDEKGEYVWHDAPSDVIEFDILQRGFMDARNTKLAPSDKQQIVTLKSPLKITGNVTDAKRAIQLSRLRLVHGISFGGRQPINWQSSVTRQGKDGRYDFAFSYPRPGHYLRFDAIGYESKASRKFTDAEGAVTFDVKLQPSRPLVGRWSMLPANPSLTLMRLSTQVVNKQGWRTVELATVVV